MDSKVAASRDEFELWLFNMDDALASFLKTYLTKQMQSLDYSPGSLNILENWLLSRYPNVISTRPSSEAVVVDGAARYVGETYRKTLGGKWNIKLDDPKYAYHGLPILQGDHKKSTPLCPHTLVTTSVDRRTGTFLNMVLSNSSKF